jgi:hypothetical protein
LGDRQAVAAELHVHRQTVRYRLAQLRELFGDALDDPRFRMKLVLALGWRPGGREAPPKDDDQGVPEPRRREDPQAKGGSARSKRSSG